jgi:hypothetical protein
MKVELKKEKKTQKKTTPHILHCIQIIDVWFVPNLDNLIIIYYSVNMFTNQYTRKYYDKKKKLKIRKGNQNPYIKEQTA